MHACPAYIILLDLITLPTFSEEYRLGSSSLSNFLHDLSSSLLGPNILLNTVLRNPHSIYLLKSERPSLASTQHNWQNHSFVYFNL
jgi:hypothetical protein